MSRARNSTKQSRLFLANAGLSWWRSAAARWESSLPRTTSARGIITYQPAAWSIALVVLAWFASGCSSITTGQDDPPAYRPPLINDNVRQAVRTQHQFGWGLYRELARKPGNLFYSPASVATAMAMVTTGASGETLNQMLTTLRIPDDQESYHAAMTELINLFNTRDKGLQMRMVNRLWGQHDVVFRDDFLAGLLQQYYAPLGKVDFSQNPESVRLKINAWVATQTDNRIRDLFAPGSIDRNTRLVLANAIYFKADWKTPFPKSATKTEDFFAADESTVRVPMMQRTGDMLYAEDESVQLVSLPYTTGNVSMVILLPKERNGLDTLESKLNAEYVQHLLSQLSRREVNLSMPRFTFSARYILNDVLQTMGLRRAFAENAEFDRMTTQERLYISIVVHQAFVEVNEEGTEAAAATGVEMRVTSAPAEAPPVTFRADHPFLFLIRHDPSEAILFAGRLSQPHAN